MGQDANAVTYVIPLANSFTATKAACAVSSQQTGTAGLGVVCTVRYNGVDLGTCNMFAPCGPPCICTMTFNQAATAGTALTVLFVQTSGAENGLTSVTIS